MKKLLVLSLVLGIASLATAGYTLVITEMDNTTAYNGRALAAGETLLIDIVGADDDSIAGSFTIMTQIAGGTLSGGTGAYGISGMLGSAADNFVGSIAAGEDGMAGQVGHGTAQAPYPNVPFITDILFTSAGVEAVLTMYDIAQDWDNAYTPGLDVAPNGVWDSATIVPEPATMALLGLGALVLRRKK